MKNLCYNKATNRKNKTKNVLTFHNRKSIRYSEDTPMHKEKGPAGPARRA